jgi:DNA adenine methylase
MNVRNLEKIYHAATKNVQKAYIKDAEVNQKIVSVCQCDRNKAPIRYLLSAMLAKIDDETIDTRQPYPNLGNHSFAGRSIDETIIQPLIHKYQLPCNDTTAFLTPAFRTIESALTKSAFDKCRPAYVYYDMIDILDYVEEHPQEAQNVLKRILAVLTSIKMTRENRVSQLVDELSRGEKQELASEEITTLLQQHLQCKGSSRLPVLMITAAYLAVQHLTGETTKPLLAHNAADRQTGAIGDVEIILQNENGTITCYEMKKKQVTTDDIYVCAEKILGLEKKPDNYIVITTEAISKDVKDLAYTFYSKIGVEIAVLDCIGFINHFLHFFHRYRTSFLDNYQQLVLKEPNSSVSQPLKEAFLSLRQVAESEA